MKLVIDIPEERYKDIQRIAEVQLERRSQTAEQIIANGTPLPKGHGRLIDADELKKIWRGCKFVGSIDCLVDCRPTIIEADKAESEDKK